jgi:hypothetical protein
MNKVTRHPIDAESARKRATMWAEDVAARLREARQSLVHCNPLRQTAEQHAGYLSVVDPNSAEICRALRLATQAVAALFRGATAREPEIAVVLGDPSPVRVPARVPSDLANVRNWCEGFFLAAICRETGALDTLSGVPPERLRASSTRAEDYAYLFADALRSYWQREGDAPARLLEALKATDPDRLPAAARDYVLSVVVPQMEMLYRLMLQEADDFNAALRKALEGHKSYWSKSVENRNKEASAFIAVGPTGLASFAHDAGMKIEVESDYMPKPLVEGGCRQPAGH